MSKQVKERKAAQRQTLTIGKLVNGIRTMEQATAKNNAIEKARQAFKNSQTFRSLGDY